jgi:transitional endoplasmic reticulum ATPase
MNRVIPECLAQIDGLKSGPAGILLLGATNRPWDLDPAAMRHGRFGEHIYVSLPDRPARRYILDATLSTVPLEPDVDLEAIAERTTGFSGADLQGLVDRIIDPAFDRAMQSGQSTPVTLSDVERALAGMRPSVSEKDLRRYERFRDSGE